MDDDGGLPLHEAAAYQPPLDVIEALLRAHPDAASTPSLYGGILPLHWAACSHASLEVVTALLEAHPAAASTASFSGELPLHWAKTQFGTHASVDVATALLAAFPEGAAVRTNAADGGRLPDLSAYPPPAILAALKAAAAARRWRAPIAWHMWHRM